jgi:phosphoglycerate kinase
MNGKVVVSDRLKEHAKTVRELCEKGAAVVLLAHQSQPGKKDFISLKQHARLMNKFVKIKFADDVIGKKAISAIKKLKCGKALLLDNVRFSSEEYKKGKNKLISSFLPYFDIFVLDAFSVAHRNETSVSGFPKFMKSCMGRVFENELEHADMFMKKSGLVAVLGGVKIDDYFGMMNRVLRKNIAKKILAAGALAELLLKAKGVDLGKTDSFLKESGLEKLLPKVRSVLKKYGSRIELPVDVAVDAHGKRKEIMVEELPSEYIIYDIGSRTIKRYSEIIRKSKSVYLKGAIGVYEKKPFALGTKMILKSISQSRAFSFIGGGHSSEAVDYFKINKNKIGYVSLSGGAMLKYMAGEKLPGLEALKHGI